MHASNGVVALLVAALVFGFQIARAAETTSPESAVKQALEHNPDLAAAAHVIDMASGRLRQAGLWANPELELEGTDDFLFNGEGERGITAGFEQRFPVAGRLGRAKDVARIDIALAEAELHDARRQIAGEVSQVAYRLMVLQNKIATQDELIEKAGDLLRVAEDRFAAAETSEADVNLLKVQLGEFREERRLMTIDPTTEAARLHELLGQAPGPPLWIEGDLEAPVALDSRDDLVETALRRRADLAQRRLETDRGGAEERLARAEKWEDWAVGVLYTADRQVFDEPGPGVPLGVGSPQQDQFMGLRIRVPLPIWNRNQGRIAEAHAGQKRAAAKLAAAELAVRREVEAAWSQVKRLGEAVEAYRGELIGLSDRNVALIKDGYADGLVGISELVQAQQQSANIRQRYYGTLGQLWQARVDLQTATASDPLLVEQTEAQPGKP